jgi:succinate dehydrogenase / fumarate reductase cytochrome b subunit
MSVNAKPKPVARKPIQWIDLRGRRVGFWAYLAMRLSGIGLVVYLYLHLVILNQLTAGPGAWDGFVALARSPIFLALDVVLIIGLLVHGLNGLRLALVGFGIGVPRHKTMLWIGVALAVILSVLSALAIFSKG